MKFEWDSKKEKQNLNKHGISFDEASKIFKGRADYLEFYDESRSEDEDRFIAIGSIAKGLIVVVYVERDFDVIRIVSARKATRSEVVLFNDFKRGKNK